jgi:dipeptidyl aminopeptidase/acylaminoacyl peptidase
MRREDRLGEILRTVPVPGAEEAERRGLPVLVAALEGREPVRRSPAPRLALAFATALAAAALVLSPAGASVRDWVGEVFSASTPAPAPALTEIPGGGRLLVESEAGTWVVQPDGSRRLIGRYEEASWSKPLGLFVAAAAGRTLSAVEPGGTVHWSLSAPGPVSDPRWSPSGFRIAYRSGHSLRVADADGERDRLLAPRVAPVPPAWLGSGPHYLAFVDAGGRLRIVDADRRETISSVPALAGIVGLGWAADGTLLLEYSRGAVQVRRVRPSKLSGAFRLGPARGLALPEGATVEAASFAPHDHTVAVTLRRPDPSGRTPRGEVELTDPGGGLPRQLLNVPGQLSAAVWSPDGSRLLVPWPGTDEWLFIPVHGGPGRAFGPISNEFAPGAGAAGAEFPEVEGWAGASRAAAPPG